MTYEDHISCQGDMFLDVFFQNGFSIDLIQVLINPNQYLAYLQHGSLFNLAFVFCIQRSLKDQPSVQHWPHSTIWDEELYCNILLVYKIHTTVSHKNLGVQSNIQVTVG